MICQLDLGELWGRELACWGEKRARRVQNGVLRDGTGERGIEGESHRINIRTILGKPRSRWIAD